MLVTYQKLPVVKQDIFFAKNITWLESLMKLNQYEIRHIHRPAIAPSLAG